ncbi:MAG: hypothetical protein R3F24_07955 [Gammaproteobacteria bacterium]
MSRPRYADPAEVEMVSDRYRSYRDFMQGRDGELPLEGWFRFYRLEKQSRAPTRPAVWSAAVLQPAKR